MTISTASSCAQTRYQSTINDNARVQILESIESCSGIYYLSMLAGFPAVEIQASHFFSSFCLWTPRAEPRVGHAITLRKSPSPERLVLDLPGARLLLGVPPKQ